MAQTKEIKASQNSLINAITVNDANRSFDPNGDSFNGTVKLTYKTVSGTADLAFLNIFRELPICVYIQDRYVEWEKQLIEKSGLEYQR